MTEGTTTTNTLPTACLFSDSECRWFVRTVWAGLCCCCDQITPTRQARIMMKSQEMMIVTGTIMIATSTSKTVKKNIKKRRKERMKIVISKH